MFDLPSGQKKKIICRCSTPFVGGEAVCPWNLWFAKRSAQKKLSLPKESSSEEHHSNSANVLLEAARIRSRLTDLDVGLRSHYQRRSPPGTLTLPAKNSSRCERAARDGRIEDKGGKSVTVRPIDLNRGCRPVGQ
jgi:hypothetical protein